MASAHTPEKKNTAADMADIKKPKYVKGKT